MTSGLLFEDDHIQKLGLYQQRLKVVVLEGCIPCVWLLFSDPIRAMACVSEDIENGLVDMTPFWQTQGLKFGPQLQ